MKKVILFAAILFAGVSVIKAQTAGSIKGTVQFQLNLHAFQTIEIGGGEEGDLNSETGLVNGAVILDYNTVDKYESGVLRTINDHIKIQSAGGFVVKVNSAVDNLTDGNSAGNVSMGTILLSAIAKDEVVASYNNELGLSTAKQTFISRKSGLGKEMKFDVTYSGAGGNAYGSFVDKAGNVRYLQTTITYEIVPG